MELNHLPVVSHVNGIIREVLAQLIRGGLNMADVGEEGPLGVNALGEADSLDNG